MVPAAGCCDIFLARLADLRPAHLAALDLAEAGRAGRYLRQPDRERFVLGAVLLKAVVGQRLGRPAAAVVIDRTCPRCGSQHGRPRLAAASGPHLSVSHSGAVVAVGVTSAGPVGVDVEAVRDLDTGSLAASVCTPDELTTVRGPADFYVYWTRKEAVLKATGEGLARPLSEVRVSPPGAVPRLLALAGEPPPCQLADLAAGAGYRGAAAVLAAGPVEFAVQDGGPLLAAAARHRT